MAQISLPVELVENILKRAWWAAKPPTPEPRINLDPMAPRYQYYRARLLHTLELVCKVWYAVIHRIIFQSIIVHTHGDLELYAGPVRRALSTLSFTDSESKTEFDQAHRRLFASSYLSVYFHNVVYQADTDDLPLSADLASRHGFNIPCVPDARVMEVCSIYDFQNVPKQPTLNAWQWLGQTKHVASVITYEPIRARTHLDSDRVSLRIPAISNIQFLGNHLNEFRDGIIARFIQFIPSLASVVLDAGDSLKHLSSEAAHPGLWCLTLKCPPNATGTSYLQPWCIRSALAKGVLRRGPGTATTPRRCLIIHGGSNVDQIGLQNAMRACQDFDVELSYIVEY